MDDYRCWNKHGDKGVNERDGEEGLHETCANGNEEAPYGNEEAPFGNEELCDDDVAEIVASPIPMADNLEEMVCDGFNFDEYTGSEFKKLKQLLVNMKTPLYPSCNERYTKLSTSLKLLQLKATHHWTNKGFRELLEVLVDMFPEGNQIPRTTYEAKKIICMMGLKFKKIHACKNDCILFHGDNVALTECLSVGPLITSEELMRVIMARRRVVEFLGRLLGTSL
jgi:hypothetical protein